MVGPLQWGVGGAALATVVSQAVSVLLCLEFVRRRIPALHMRRADWRVSRADLGEHLRLGLPMGFQASIIAIGTLSVQVALNELGAESVAAYTAASRVDGLAVALLQSLGLAVSMFAAQNHGGGRPDRIRRGVVQATWMSVAAALVLGGLLIAFGRHLVHLFIEDGSDAVFDMAGQMLAINGATYWILGILFVLRGALQGLGHTVIPTITGVIELVMRVAAAVVLGSLIGFAGVAMSNPLAWLGAVVVLVPAYVVAHRELARMRVTPLAPTPTTPIAVIGPTDGSMVVDAVVTRPIPLPARARSPGRCRSCRADVVRSLARQGAPGRSAASFQPTWPAITRDRPYGPGAGCRRGGALPRARQRGRRAPPTPCWSRANTSTTDAPTTSRRITVSPHVAKRERISIDTATPVRTDPATAPATGPASARPAR